jgi:hypothetical protein
MRMPERSVVCSSTESRRESSAWLVDLLKLLSVLIRQKSSLVLELQLRRLAPRGRRDQEPKNSLEHVQNVSRRMAKMEAYEHLCLDAGTSPGESAQKGVETSPGSCGCRCRTGWHSHARGDKSVHMCTDLYTVHMYTMHMYRLRCRTGWPFQFCTPCTGTARYTVHMYRLHCRIPGSSLACSGFLSASPLAIACTDDCKTGLYICAFARLHYLCTSWYSVARSSTAYGCLEASVGEPLQDYEAQAQCRCASRSP